MHSEKESATLIFIKIPSLSYLRRFTSRILMLYVYNNRKPQLNKVSYLRLLGLDSLRSNFGRNPRRDIPMF